MNRELKIWITGLAMLCCAGAVTLRSQDISPAEQLIQFDQKYGNDPRLVNGEKYYYPYTRSDGDPFLESSPRQASLQIGDNVFEDQAIRYDIYNQLLVLEYKDVYGANSSLVLPGASVREFRYPGRFFKRMQAPDGKYRFLQVVYEGPVSCYYSWKKEYRLNAASGTRDYYFTDPIRESFLVMGHTFYGYRGNRSFSKIFEDEDKKAVRQFMRRDHIHVRTASGTQMKSLMEFCNSLADEAL